jgi:hypothetical protein
VRQFSLRECRARPLACLQNWSRATSRRRNSLMRPSRRHPLRLRQLKQKNQSRNRSPKRKSPRQRRRLPQLLPLPRLHRRPDPLRRGSRWVTHRGRQPPDNSRAGRKPLGQRHRLVRNNRHNRRNLCGRRRPRHRRHSRPSHRSRYGPTRRPPPVLRDKISTRAAASCVSCRRISFIK